MMELHARGILLKGASFLALNPKKASAKGIWDFIIFLRRHKWNLTGTVQKKRILSSMEGHFKGGKNKKPWKADSRWSMSC